MRSSVSHFLAEFRRSFGLISSGAAPVGVTRRPAAARRGLSCPARRCLLSRRRSVGGTGSHTHPPAAPAPAAAQLTAQRLQRPTWSMARSSRFRLVWVPYTPILRLELFPTTISTLPSNLVSTLPSTLASMLFLVALTPTTKRESESDSGVSSLSLPPPVRLVRYPLGRSRAVPSSV